jgi:hypothetical protein
MATLIALSPANKDINYYSNDEFDSYITITDQDDAPVNLSGKTLTLTVKKKKADTATIIEISTTSEITISGANNNIVTFSGQYDLPERSYYFDLHNNTDDKTLVYGRFIVTKKVHD